MMGIFPKESGSDIMNGKAQNGRGIPAPLAAAANRGAAEKAGETEPAATLGRMSAKLASCLNEASPKLWGAP